MKFFLSNGEWLSGKWLDLLELLVETKNQKSDKSISWWVLSESPLGYLLTSGSLQVFHSKILNQFEFFPLSLLLICK